MSLQFQAAWSPVWKSCLESLCWSRHAEMLVDYVGIVSQSDCTYRFIMHAFWLVMCVLCSGVYTCMCLYPCLEARGDIRRLPLPLLALFWSDRVSHRTWSSPFFLSRLAASKPRLTSCFHPSQLWAICGQPWLTSWVMGIQAVTMGFSMPIPILNNDLYIC